MTFSFRPISILKSWMLRDSWGLAKPSLQTFRNTQCHWISRSGTKSRQTAEASSESTSEGAPKGAYGTTSTRNLTHSRNLTIDDVLELAKAFTSKNVALRDLRTLSRKAMKKQAFQCWNHSDAVPLLVLQMTITLSTSEPLYRKSTSWNWAILDASLRKGSIHKGLKWSMKAMK